MRKALTAAAANYGCPMLWIEGHTTSPESNNYQGEIVFDKPELSERYLELSPKGIVDLVVIGCPQASVGEARAAAAASRARMELGEQINNKRLWLFTSRYNYDILESDGTVSILEEAGALILKDTCPEVTPYNRNHYNHILTNSLKAEHYLTSGLNRMPTSVANIYNCVAHAFDDELLTGPRPILSSKTSKNIDKNSVFKIPIAHGEGRYHANDSVIDDLFSSDQVLFQYCDSNGIISEKENLYLLRFVKTTNQDSIISSISRDHLVNINILYANITPKDQGIMLVDIEEQITAAAFCDIILS